MVNISVIIPTFNRKQLLTKTLDSILKQSLQPSEIIVIDDHSDDGTAFFLKENYDGKIIVKENNGKGPGAARNTGMSIATGDFIKFFDSDDLMTTNMLEVQLRQLLNSSSSFVYSPYFYAHETSLGDWTSKDNVILNYHPFDRKYPLWHYMIMNGLFITIPGMLFKRDLLEKVGKWREDATASEDWEYLFRISLHEPSPIHTNECAFLYRLHEAQTTAGNFSNQQRDTDKIKILKGLYDSFIDTDDRFTFLEKLAYQNMFYQVWRVAPTDHSIKGMLNDYDSLMQRLVWQVQRLRSKVGRMRTRTAWQPCHGPLNSKEKIDYYLSIL